MSAKRGPVLVTGGTGFIGSHLVETLLERGYHVRCLVRSTSDLRYLDGLPVDLIQGDLRKLETLVGCAEGADVVFHVAGITAAINRRGYYEGNALATANLVHACLAARRRPRRLLYVSSIAAAGPSPNGVPRTEPEPPQPVSPYGRTKLAGERAVWSAAHLLPVTVIRPPIVYGPRDRDLYKYFVFVNRGIVPLIGHRPHYLSFIYVKDLVGGIIRAAECDRAAGQCYFLADQSDFRHEELARMVSRAMEKPSLRLIVMPEALWYAVGLVMELLTPVIGDPSILSREKVWEATQGYWTCDPSKAHRDLGWSAQTPLEEGLRETVQWYRREGWL